MILVRILIALLCIIILLQIYYWIKSAMGIKEGMDPVGPPPTTPPASCPLDGGISKDPVYLSTLNSANIKMLSDKITNLDVDNINKEIASLQTQVQANNTAIRMLGEQISNATNQIVGKSFNSPSEVPSATGLN